MDGAIGLLPIALFINIKSIKHKEKSNGI